MKKSETIKNLAGAMVKFRQQIKQPLKDADNPFFKSKYVPLENVVEVIDKVASPLGLSFIQEATSNELGMVGVATTIFHESGEWIEFEPLYLKPEKSNAQGYGSSVTYARRYSLSSAFGITSDKDDDGNEASGNRDGKKSNAKQHPQENVEFLGEKAKIFKGYGIDKKTMLAGINMRLQADALTAPIKNVIEVTKLWLSDLEKENTGQGGNWYE
ncbi:TPA: ERF family protein [Streptococcus suis]